MNNLAVSGLCIIYWSASIYAVGCVMEFVKFWIEEREISLTFDLFSYVKVIIKGSINIYCQLKETTNKRQ